MAGLKDLTRRIGMEQEHEEASVLSPKSGFKTSEFWLVIVTLLMNFTELQNTYTGVAAMAVAAVYAACRAWLKGRK